MGSRKNHSKSQPTTSSKTTQSQPPAISTRAQSDVKEILNRYVVKELMDSIGTLISDIQNKIVVLDNSISEIDINSVIGLVDDQSNTLNTILENASEILENLECLSENIGSIQEQLEKNDECQSRINEDIKNLQQHYEVSLHNSVTAITENSDNSLQKVKSDLSRLLDSKCISIAKESQTILAKSSKMETTITAMIEMLDEIETSVISVAEENKNTLQETISVIDEKIKNNMTEIQSMQAEIRERNNKLYLGLFSLGVINCLGIFAIILIQIFC